MYKTLGIISLILVILITAPYWLRMLNSWIFRTKDKRFMSLLKFLRKLHKPLGLALVAIALWHGYQALGGLRLHTGLLAFAGFIITACFGGIYYKTKQKKFFKAHKIMALVSVSLLALHLIWPSALWYLFRI